MVAVQLTAEDALFLCTEIWTVLLRNAVGPLFQGPGRI